MKKIFLLILFIFLISCDDIKRNNREFERNRVANELIDLEPELEEFYKVYYADLHLSWEELEKLYEEFLLKRPKWKDKIIMPPRHPDDYPDEKFKEQKPKEKDWLSD